MNQFQCILNTEVFWCRTHVISSNECCAWSAYFNSKQYFIIIINLNTANLSAKWKLTSRHSWMVNFSSELWNHKIDINVIMMNESTIFHGHNGMSKKRVTMRITITTKKNEKEKKNPHNKWLLVETNDTKLKWDSWLSDRIFDSLFAVVFFSLNFLLIPKLSFPHSMYWCNIELGDQPKIGCSVWITSDKHCYIHQWLMTLWQFTWCQKITNIARKKTDSVIL